MNRDTRRRLAHDLGLQPRAIGPKGPAAGDKPTIFTPEPEGAPCGQLLMSNHLASHFIEYPWRGEESIREMARRLHEFLLGEEPFFEFIAPNDGEVHLLTRIGAASVVAINHARAKGPIDPRGLAQGSKIVRVGGALPPELLKR